MARPRQKHAPEVVALMRGGVQDLVDHPEHALRLLLRIDARLAELNAEIRRVLGLLPNELVILLTLWDRGASDMTTAARRANLSRAAMTTMVDRLEGEGLVRRTPEPTDRRRMLVHVTPRFEQVMWDVAREADAQLRRDAAADHQQWQATCRAAGRLVDIADDQLDALRSRSPRARSPRNVEQAELDESAW